MRISQLKSLSQDELALILYIVNVIDPTLPGTEIFPEMLLYFRHNLLMQKLANQEIRLNEFGKKIYESLVTKLNKTWIQEIQEYECATK